MPDRPRLLSGMQPTADSLHLGNYLGALRHWVAMQDGHEAYYFVADLHALTVRPNPADVRRRTRVTAAQFLAAGVDPVRSALFVQSHVPEHAQLMWLLACHTGYGEAGRMTQFKDKAGREGADRASLGLFAYPVLQAADILLYQAAAVPVGEDQRQHLELTRDLAERWNSRYGSTFVVPEPRITRDTGKILDLQDPARQMSKSAAGAGCLFLLDDPAVGAKRIRSALTDAGREVTYEPDAKPGVANLLRILAALTGGTAQEVAGHFAGQGYGELKKAVAAAYTDFARGFGERAQAWLDDGERLDAVLADGAERAREVAQATLARAYDAVGLLRP